MNARGIICCAVGLVVIVPKAPAATAEQTILKRKGREPELVDEAAYSRVSREYRVTRGRVTLSVPAAQVEYCKPPKPHGFDKLNDIAELEAVLKKHHRLWWDVAASHKLMPLYLKREARGKLTEKRYGFIVTCNRFLVTQCLSRFAVTTGSPLIKAVNLRHCRKS